MFAPRIFPERYFAPRYYPAGTDTTSSPTVPGLEWSTLSNLVHFSVAGRPHYSTLSVPAHYNVSSLLHWSAVADPVHYSVKDEDA